MLPAELGISEEFVRNFHLATLVVCVWLVISADLTAAKSSLHPLNENDFRYLHFNHTLLVWGLFVFWCTGAYLVWLGTSFDLSQFSPKLIAKITVVSGLTLNAFVIGRFALPYLEQKHALKFGEHPIEMRLRLALCGSFSSASWIGAFCLGAMSHLKTASAVELISFLAPIYAGLAIVASLFAVISGYRTPKIGPIAPTG